MSHFVTAVNARGEKQVIPAHWLDHPTLSKGFRRPPSTSSKRAKVEKPVEKVDEIPSSTEA